MPRQEPLFRIHIGRTTRGGFLDTKGRVREKGGTVIGSYRVSGPDKQDSAIISMTGVSERRRRRRGLLGAVLEIPSRILRGALEGNDRR